MRLSFKFKPNFSHKQLEIVKELSWHCSKLYNIVNYDVAIPIQRFKDLIEYKAKLG